METCKDERLAAAQEDAPNDTSFNENPETDNLDDFERNTVCSEDRDSDIEMIEAGDGSHSSSKRNIHMNLYAESLKITLYPNKIIFLKKARHKIRCQ